MMKHKGANQRKSTTARRNALGRGLSALMSSTSLAVDISKIQDAESAEEAVSPVPARAVTPLRKFEDFETVDAEEEVAPSETFATESGDETLGESGLVYMPLDRVVANESQPRQYFAKEEIESLAQSLRESGLLQPILVRKKENESGPLARYEIVAGERRFRAAKLSGLTKIPVIIKQLTDKEALQLAIVENIQRANLNPLEEARAYQRLIDDFGETQADVATAVGKDRASIANAIRLLKLAPDVQEMLAAGQLSAGHGRALLMLEKLDEQRAIAERIIREGLSVRATEQLCSQSGQLISTQENKVQKPTAKAAKLPAVNELEERFRRALGTKVTLQMNPQGKGELKIQFFSKDELASLLEKFEA